jgi:hypothetical protein
MKRIEKIALIIFLVGTPLVTCHAQGKGWRGIVPLHSTRTDVERLWGAPSEQLALYSVVYRTGNETILIDYAKGQPCSGKSNPWRVPRNTVVRISVTLNKGLPLSELRIDQIKYKKRSGGERAEDVYYVNEHDGETLRVFQGEVLDMSYFPALSDEHLRCPVKRKESRGQRHKH